VAVAQPAGTFGAAQHAYRVDADQTARAHVVDEAARAPVEPLVAGTPCRSGGVPVKMDAWAAMVTVGKTLEALSNHSARAKTVEVGQAPILVSLLEGVAAHAVHVDDDGAPRRLSPEPGGDQQDGGPEARHRYCTCTVWAIMVLSKMIPSPGPER